MTNIENEINELQLQLNLKKKEAAEIKLNELKEQYGANFGCGTCRYCCAVDVDDHHTYCLKGNCIYCHTKCDKYKPHNNLSAYIEECYYYAPEVISALEKLFGKVNILDKEELHDKVINVLELVKGE
jgi:hypothetical protein